MDAISVSSSQSGRNLQVKPEQQLKRTQSRSNSGSGRYRGAVDSVAAEADKNGEQQLKRIDAIGEQQLKRTQSGSGSSDRVTERLSDAELLT